MLNSDVYILFWAKWTVSLRNTVYQFSFFVYEKRSDGSFVLRRGEKKDWKLKEKENIDECNHSIKSFLSWFQPKHVSYLYDSLYL